MQLPQGELQNPPWSIMGLHYVYVFLYVLLFSFPVLNCSATACLSEDAEISDRNDTILISPGRIFELGFFTPDGNLNNSRYLGIWYYMSNPKIVVWVANREKPLLDANGYLVIKNGTAKVLDANGKIYWSTDSLRSANSAATANSVPSSKLLDVNGMSYLSTNDVGSSPRYVGIQTSDNLSHPNSTRFLNISLPNSTTHYAPPDNHTVSVSVGLCLDDGGMLVLDNGRNNENILWRSFGCPIVDTFLPGMRLDGDFGCGPFNLTSWRSPYDPAMGSYVLLPQLTVQEKKLSIYRDGSTYWESRMPFDMVPDPLFKLLLGDPDYNDIRLVMNFTGQIQLWKNETRKGWTLGWSQPKDKCSLYEACGNFGSCNSNNGLLCKCLPGFKPLEADNWNSGAFSGGCVAKFMTPCTRNSFRNDIFLKLPMMRVGNPDYNETSEDCEAICLQDCSCLAYSCGTDNCRRMGSTSDRTKCMRWSSVLTNLQEEYPGGYTLFVRATPSDIESTSRDCSPCGAYSVPYPLSTDKNCGDSSYFNFHCNTSTGQLSFLSSFKVTSIDPNAARFSIQLKNATSCDLVDSRVLPPNQSLPFNVKNCSRVTDQLFATVGKSFIEVQMSWELPSEPVCHASSDCRDWPHTTCKRARDGKMRCICGSKLRWNGLKLQCTRVPFPVKVVVLSVIIALVFVLLGGTFFIHRVWKRRISNSRRQGLAGLDELKNDTEGIDVPFFNWETILAATDNFVDANKLGKGGFGSVYMGELPDGRQIAVKRLSNISLQRIEEFRTEVMLIAKLQHRNLVRLLGYCVKADEKILLYEYMPNGSLDTYLFDQTRSVFLDWEKRFEIIFGICRGLLYLHQDSRLRIIHRDLKPSNILLDEELNPKISDFGIARIVGGPETEECTKRVVGTYGYMSPEYAYEGLFSVKSDVFSFGVVVLEIISAKRNSRLFQVKDGVSLLVHAWRLWREDRPLDLVDQTIKESCKPTEVLKCIHIGLLCVQANPGDRPNMSSVLLMLSSENTCVTAPNQPAFFTREQSSDRNAASSSVSGSSMSNVVTLSIEAR